jgi:hypothetical protein
VASGFIATKAANELLWSDYLLQAARINFVSMNVMAECIRSCFRLIQPRFLKVT